CVRNDTRDGEEPRAFFEIERWPHRETLSSMWRGGRAPPIEKLRPPPFCVKVMGRGGVVVAAEHTSVAARVRGAVPGDDDTLESVLVRACEDDPVIRWVFPDDEEARRLYFRTNLELGHPNGTIFTVDSRAGFAIWAPPGEWRVSLWTQLLLVPRIIRMLGVRRFQRGMMVFDRLQKEHQEGPHYYLGV